MKITTFVIIGFLCLLGHFSQAQRRAVDTIHYRKIYYLGGTGMGFPLGKTNAILAPRFSGSMGLDISLKNPRYFLSPTLYTLSFNYKQRQFEEGYSYRIEDVSTNFYTLSLAGGTRKQFYRLNTYVFAGPGIGFSVEPRANVLTEENLVRLDKVKKLNFSSKIGVGADYKFKGFFLGLEVGYLHQFRNIQDTPVNIMTVMVGLKSDITQIGDKVVDVIGIDGSISGKEQR